MGLFSGPGINPNLRGLNSNVISLNASETWLIQPAGWYMIRPGRYTTIQTKDPITNVWRNIGDSTTSAVAQRTYSDGVNFRLANQTGCAIGALITNAGSAYTSAPTVTASAGSSVWSAIVGGAISTTVTVTNVGASYTYPPAVVISPPPPGGIQATAVTTLSGTGIGTITVVDQGAGYIAVPTVTFVNDPREGLNNVSVGYGGAAVASLTGAGTITGLLCLDHGTGAQTAVPTLSFTGGGGSSAAATVIMCWSITSYVVSATTAGSGYALPVLVSAFGGFPSTAAAYTNVSTQSQLLKSRAAVIQGSVSGVALTTVGQTVLDGGIYPGAPTAFAYPGPYQSGNVAAILLAPNMGGQNSDVSVIQST
jgi:hypothetical protein